MNGAALRLWLLMDPGDMTDSLVCLVALFLGAHYTSGFADLQGLSGIFRQKTSAAGFRGTDGDKK
ncbi:MAG: hypothetical protein KF859_07955 [Phycisphaeraceae bacterium]|nr:hypothetical protein [Phycisphaeraceae bacterium]